MCACSKMYIHIRTKKFLLAYVSEMLAPYCSACRAEVLFLGLISARERKKRKRVGMKWKEETCESSVLM